MTATRRKGSLRDSSSELTHTGHCVFPLDDVGLSLVELSHALPGDVNVIKLADVPNVHLHSPDLHQPPVLRLDLAVPPLHIESFQHHPHCPLRGGDQEFRIVGLQLRLVGGLCGALKHHINN